MKKRLLVMMIAIGLCVIAAQYIMAESNVPKNDTEKAETKEMPKEITGKDGAKMVLIPAGEFRMGDSLNEGNSNERPVHTVYLVAFYMDVYEVTNAQFKKFVRATGYKEIYVNGIRVGSEPWQDKNYSGDNLPVVYVRWDDAKAYAEWAGKRLPTEAEWEKAARGGLVEKRYPWGDNLTHDDANYWEKGGKDVWTNISPICSFAPNGYGLYDMAGNVWEWCADWYGQNYYVNAPKSNPKGPDSGRYKILRGGSWRFSYGSALRTACRNYGQLPWNDYDTGFRCVQDVPK